VLSVMIARLGFNKVFFYMRLFFLIDLPALGLKLFSLAQRGW